MATGRGVDRDQEAKRVRRRRHAVGRPQGRRRTGQRPGGVRPTDATVAPAARPQAELAGQVRPCRARLTVVAVTGLRRRRPRCFVGVGQRDRPLQRSRARGGIAGWESIAADSSRSAASTASDPVASTDQRCRTPSGNPSGGAERPSVAGSASARGQGVAQCPQRLAEIRLVFHAYGQMPVADRQAQGSEPAVAGDEGWPRPGRRTPPAAPPRGRAASRRGPSRRRPASAAWPTARAEPVRGGSPRRGLVAGRRRPPRAASTHSPTTPCRQCAWRVRPRPACPPAEDHRWRRRRGWAAPSTSAGRRPARTVADRSRPGRGRTPRAR